MKASRDNASAAGTQDTPILSGSEQKRAFTADEVDIALTVDLGIVDCLGEVLGIGNFETVLNHSIPVDLPFGTCRILEIEALIRAKEAMGRDHDRVTVRQLAEVKRLRQQPPLS